VSKGDKTEKDGLVAVEVVLSRKGQGERVKTQIVHAKNFDGTAVIWVHPDGIKSVWRDGKLVPAAQAVVDKGAGILAVEPFRTGDAANDRPNVKVASLAYAGYFYGYNRALVAERVHDILTAVAFVKASIRRRRSISSLREGRPVGGPGARPVPRHRRTHGGRSQWLPFRAGQGLR